MDRERIASMRVRETERFLAARPYSRELLERARRSMPDGVPMAWMHYLYAHPPIFVAEASGAHFTDVDGHRYLDMNLADSTMSCGYAPEPVFEAVARQFRRGSQYLLPNEDTVLVAEMLAARFGLPRWQFTLSASNANAEAIRIARSMTRREGVLLFDGKYHGMLDETLHRLDGGELKHEALGLPSTAGQSTRIVQYNDLAGVQTALETEAIACILVEAAITNVGGIVRPEPGFHEGLRELARAFGTLLVVDEAHTHVCAYGGLTRAWSLDPDILVLGKPLGGGIPVGAYGVSERVAQFLESVRGESRSGRAGRIATGGASYANALQMAATRATLEHVLTEAAHEEIAALGKRLADGIDETTSARGLAWRAYRLYCRSGYHFADILPRNNRDMAAARDEELRETMRIYMANRGVWEAQPSSSAAVSFAATENDVDCYLGVLGECLDELIGRVGS